MQVIPPFDWLPRGDRLRVFVVALVATLLLFWVLLVIGRPFVTDAAPLGIVSFELAGDVERAHAIVDSWSDDVRVAVGFQTGLDYLYIVCYATSMALACTLIAGALSPKLPVVAGTGYALAWAQLCAGVLDAVENVALMRMLLRSQSELWPELARWCAAPKFAIIAVGLGYLALAGTVALLLRLRGRS